MKNRDEVCVFSVLNFIVGSTILGIMLAGIFYYFSIGLNLYPRWSVMVGGICTLIGLINCIYSILTTQLFEKRYVMTPFLANIGLIIWIIFFQGWLSTSIYQENNQIGLSLKAMTPLIPAVFGILFCLSSFIMKDKYLK